MQFQTADRLYYRDAQFDLLDQPLEPYFDLIDSRPPFLRSNAASRGYFAEWTIADGWLYLTSIIALWEDGTPATIKQLFPLTGDRVFAAWLSSNLRCYNTDSSPVALQNVVRAPDVVISVNCGRVSQGGAVQRPMHRPTDRAPSNPRSAQIIDLHTRTSRLPA
jgi:hypothetical protein